MKLYWQQKKFNETYDVFPSHVKFILRLYENIPYTNVGYVF